MSNDWRVIARLISNAVPFSAPVIVSQTNSFRPYPTACTFGSNYLVAWSWDEGPYPSYWIATRDFPQYIQTNVWFPILHGRFVSPSASLIGSTMVIARGMYGNTDPAIAFDGHHYFIAWSTRDTNTVSRYANQRAQSMALDGTARYYPVITAFLLGDPVATRIAFGGDRFCILYKYVFGGGNLSQSVMVGRRAINDFKLINVQRSAGGGIQAQSTGPMQMETSTNFVDWVPGLLSDLPNMPARSQLFVRLVDRRWQCIEQLNAIDWAKHQWAANYRRASTDTPMDQDLFGAGRYLPAKPVCPHGGTYSLNVNGVKPTCTVSGHTM